MKNKFLKVLGFNLFIGKISDLPIVTKEKKNLINTMNPRVFSLSRNNERLNKSFKETDYLVMDGQYFFLAPLLLNLKYVGKISGTNVMNYYLEMANKNALKVFFMGTSESSLKNIENRIQRELPNIEVSSFSPPFRKEFSDKENIEILDKINSFQPNILIVGLTAPKQEIWAYENLNKIDANIICTVGAALDWFAGKTRQPEKLWVNLGLEWLIRTIRRPEILKRYPDYLLFFWYLFLNIINIRKD